MWNYLKYLFAGLATTAALNTVEIPNGSILVKKGD